MGACRGFFCADWYHIISACIAIIAQSARTCKPPQRLRKYGK
nr:hypothetical protein [uncultured bacterium]